MKKRYFVSFFFGFLMIFLINTKVFATDKYIIKNKEDLTKFSEEVNNGNNFEGIEVELQNDIELQGNEDNQWIPVGFSNASGGNNIEEDDTRCSFKGTFNGNGYYISGIYIDSDRFLCGLFGVNEGIIENLTIKDSYIKSSSSYVGGITAYNAGVIKNCTNYGQIICDTSAGTAGGIAGYTTVGEIIECKNMGKVKGKTGYNAGITGFCFMGNIVKCVNYGEIENEKSAGGIVGCFQTSDMYECINRGTVKAINNAGGIIGYIKRYATMEYCYNTGKVENYSESSKSNIGGIIGYCNLYTDHIIDSCYSIGEIKYVTNNEICVGQVIGSINKEQNPLIKNVYYLNKENLKAYNGNDNEFDIIAKEESDFKEEEMISLLNKNINNDRINSELNQKYGLYNEEGKVYVLDLYNQNNGFPILYWERMKPDNYDEDGTVDNNISETKGTVNKDEIINNSNNSTNKKISVTNSSEKPNMLPNTGKSKVIIVCVVLCMGVSIVLYQRHNKYRDL